MSRVSWCHRLATRIGITLRPDSSQSQELLLAARPTTISPARGDQLAQPREPRLQRQVMEDRHAGHGLEAAQGLRSGSVHDVGVEHPRRRAPRQPPAGPRQGLGVALHPHGLAAHARQLVHEEPVAAADVERTTASLDRKSVV